MARSVIRRHMPNGRNRIIFMPWNFPLKRPCGRILMIRSSKIMELRPNFSERAKNSWSRPRIKVYTFLLQYHGVRRTDAGSSHLLGRRKKEVSSLSRRTNCPGRPTRSIGIKCHYACFEPSSQTFATTYSEMSVACESCPARRIRPFGKGLAKHARVLADANSMSN